MEPDVIMENKKSSKLKWISAALLLLVLAAAAVLLYWNHMLNMINRPTMESASFTETAETAETEPVQPAPTSAEETWPQIVSDKNITNIMLVGQAARQ